MLATVYEIWDTVYITEISDLNACRGNGRWVYGTGFGACSEGKSRKCRGIFLVVSGSLPGFISFCTIYAEKYP
jgi:hypothetical protein